jgi:hypothetical protein
MSSWRIIINSIRLRVDRKLCIENVSIQEYGEYVKNVFNNRINYSFLITIYKFKYEKMQY